MFALFRRDKKDVKEVLLYAVGKGKVIPIEAVPDKTFSECLLGDGIGFFPEEDHIYAPCDGKITMVAETKHAFGLKLKNGAEVLIHVGLDTVNLNGQGLEPKISVGSVVKRGEFLLKIDRAFMEKKGIDLTTSIVLTNGDGYILNKLKMSGMVSRDDYIISIVKR